MGSLNDSNKRDFLSQLILLMESKADEFMQAGYDPTNKIDELKKLSDEAQGDEAKQQQALALAKDATKKAQTSLKTAYKEASNAVDLIAGLLGKDHNLVKEIKKMRK